MPICLVSFVCYAFVDDTDVVHAKDTHTSGQEILKEMQAVVDHCEGGVRATGGALVPAKSWWYLIDFVWENNAWRYCSKEEIPGNITIRDVDGYSRVTLERLEPHEGKETLGVILAMDGNNVDEVKKLRAKAEEFADCIRTGSISREDAWLAVNSTIMKTLEYPMIAITLSKKQWDYIMSPILIYLSLIHI